MNLATLPAHASVLDGVAQAWLERGYAPGRGLILLPTRRAARELAEAFLRVSGGRPMLLPRITALGALDEAPLALHGALDLPPAIEEMRRLAELCRLIPPFAKQIGGASRADQAWLLARELARLMDDAERAEIADLHAGLRALADGALAEHWTTTLDFLNIVTAAWPQFLADEGLMNPQARAVALLRAQTAAWQNTPPQEPVWVAGATGGIASVAGLLRVVANLAHGMVILPGLSDTPPEQVEDSHYQAGLLDLLARMGAEFGDVARWKSAETAPPLRLSLLEQALLPADDLHKWMQPQPFSTDGLFLLETDDQQHEAVAIALILRDALQTPGKRAALITPDRQLATRVAAELLRFGVVADDSAGEALAHTPQAVFLRLLAQAVVDNLAPVALLALLKHPLAAAGLASGQCRQAARDIEALALRGPKPPPGITGLRRAVGEVPSHIAFLTAFEAAISPLLRLFAEPRQMAEPHLMITRLIEAAEALAATDTISGPSRLWAGEEGEALAQTLSSALAVLDRLPEQDLAVLPGLLDALLEGIAVRGRRALRGRDTDRLHPRIFIWGLLEARLQSVDVAVLGGLVEGVWPPATDPGPWLSRQMRTKLGLRSPEEMVGQAAHDFVTLAASAGMAVLSAPRRRDNAPAVPARWLTRLAAFLKTPLPGHPAAHWARLLDQPDSGPRPAKPPRPCPPVAMRPTQLSVTEIETWLADPYAIYARRILRLEKLDPLEQATDQADYGTVVHNGIARLLNRVGATWPDDAAAQLHETMQASLLDHNFRPALAAWWRPRLKLIADWIDATERTRRRQLGVVEVLAECKGAIDLRIGRGFRLTGRADRIERRADGTLSVLDYKTGAAPNPKEVVDGYRPQLTLEAAMLARGGFGADWQGDTGELAYWKLAGAREPGKVVAPFKSLGEITQAAADALAALCRRVEQFETLDTPYLAQPHPDFKPRFPDYAQLARVAEWARGEDE